MQIEELDVVELLEDWVEERVLAGMRGTVLEIFDDGAAYLVEFSDKTGRGFAILTLRPEQIKLVWRNAPHRYVNPVDQLIEEARSLSEEQVMKLVDMIRSLRKTAA